jgi:MYXO-CTERM domain-containing protein
LLVAGGLAVALAAVDAHDAVACGCFTPPDPSVPVVQAGERILFSIDNGNVTAHIQIQYAGNASDFGWLLPLPSVPTLQLGTDELFANLIATTQPKYRLVTKYDGSCGFQPPGRGSTTFQAGAGGPAGPTATTVDGNSPLVIQDSIGPYDYAVLKADSQADMLQWLQDNHYFVPAGTDQTVSAYIHPGAYFLALKLSSGQSAGDLQPVVVNYPSDKPMIPIVLTSVAAQPNMGVQVWMLGEGRAIPVNYYHTVINDLAIDWGTAGQNYNDVIIASVAQAKDKHAFVTEYAGTSSIMKNTINYPGRFGTQADLAANTDAVAFVQYLQSHGFTFTSQLVTILGRIIPYPAGLAQVGVTQATFYANLSYYTSANAMQQYASAYAGWPGITSFDPVATAQEIQDKIVQPTVDAAALFDKYSRLTRLYTTLSPEDMTLDPVFSFNPTLPDVAKDHQATLTYYCGLSQNDRLTAPAQLVTEQGWTRSFPSGTGTAVVPPPATGLTVRRIEILGEEGPPNVVMDNPPNSGCACAIGSEGGGPAKGALLGATLGLAAAVAMRLRRRSRPRG